MTGYKPGDETHYRIEFQIQWPHPEPEEQPMAAKQPSPQSISALLRRAGFTKSVSSKSRIKGFREHSEGFIARKYIALGAVEVDYSTGFSRGPNAEKRAAEMLARYADAIRAAGYGVENDALHGLIVTAPEED